MDREEFILKFQHYLSRDVLVRLTLPDPPPEPMRMSQAIRSLVDQTRIAQHLPTDEMRQAHLGAVLASLDAVGLVTSDQDDPPPHVAPYAQAVVALLTILEAGALPRRGAFRAALIENATVRFNRAARTIIGEG